MLKPRNFLKLGALFAVLILGHAETAAAHEVTDVLGRKVEVPDHVQRVVLGEGRLISAFALLDKDAPFQRIVGWQNDLKLLDAHTYNAYVAKFPTVKDIPLIGQASEQSVSAEEILSLKPDLAVFSISGHGPTEHSPVADVLAKAGIAVLFVDFRINPVQGTHASMTALGQALGRETQAKAFLDFYDQHIKVITDAVATLPAGPRPSVFLELLAGAWQAPGHTTGKSGMGEVIKLVGGRNIAADVVPGALGDISVEYALKADPDVYVNLRAIREGNSHGLWHDFYNSPYNLLAIEALAKWVHPELFAKLDPKATMEAMNQQFLGMPLQGAYWIDGKAK